MTRRIKITLLVGLLLQPACLFNRGQQYHDFITKTPLPEDEVLILGLLGGRDNWNDPKPGVGRLAQRLRSLNLHGVHVETVENKKRRIAVQLIVNSLDRNGNGKLEQWEHSRSRIILFGQSFGGAAVVKLAKELQNMDVPVLLTVQVDSVGRHDAVIPSNVARAANFFQRNGVFIRGEPEIRPQDPRKTEIIGNMEFDYSQKKMDLSGIPWWKKIFRVAHTKMDLDPEMWTKVEEIILNEIL